jgi:murein DD-endopeptidase MepM/ murein hydrolase activator NlpD
VNTEDGLPEQLPGVLPEGQTVQTAGGNYVVVDIGRGRYAFDAHLQPGSLEVKVGDQVKTGQLLGKLGNTGNTAGRRRSTPPRSPAPTAESSRSTSR